MVTKKQLSGCETMFVIVMDDRDISLTQETRHPPYQVFNQIGIPKSDFSNFSNTNNE